MKKQIFTTVILYLIIGISVVHAQMPLKRVNELQTEANGLYDKKEYAKAVKLYQKAFAEYSAHHEFQSSIDCGLKAADLYIQLGTYKEAYDIFREINQVIRNAASRTKNPQYANYFALAKERFLLNLKLKNQSQASAQLERMADAAKGLKSTEANNELLYMQTAFDYTFGNNKAGDESMQKLITGYMDNKQYDEVIDCYQNLINLSEMANSAKLTSMMYQNFMMWRDSISAAKSREEYDNLQYRFDEALGHIAVKDDKLSNRMFIIIGTCILLGIIVILLIALLINQLRLKANNHRYKKKIRIANEFSDLKTQFIHNISSQIAPSLKVFTDTANELPAVYIDAKDKLGKEASAIASFIEHVDEITTLETSINVPYETELINVKTFCDEISGKITPLLKPDVTLSIEAPKIQVKANKEQLTRLLTHLLINSTDFTKAGTIRLDFKKRGANTYQFIVTDSGPGIDEDLRADLFKPFKHVTDLTKGDKLGLPICSLIATRMNGHLSLDTTYTKGCRFILEIHS